MDSSVFDDYGTDQLNGFSVSVYGRPELEAIAPTPREPPFAIAQIAIPPSGEP